MNRLISLILSVFIAGLAIADPNGGCNFKTGSPGCVAYTGKGLTLATQGPQDITFKTNDTARGTINGTTGAWTGMTLAAPTITGTVTIGALAGASPITVSPGSDVNRLFSFGASSDTAHTLTFGDGGTTAAQTFAIGASTADADDDSAIYIGSGGGGASTDATRGARLALFGNENGNTGAVTLAAGNVSGGDIFFATNGETTFIIKRSSNTDLVFNNTNAHIRASTSDAADSGRLVMSGGGNILSVTRGAYLELAGNEHADAGTAILYSGDPATADVSIGAADDIIFEALGGTDSLVIDTATQAATFTGKVTSSAAADIGWSVVAGTNVACNTTCTSACVFGFDVTAGNVTGLPLACTDATADVCICAGAS